jgi:outer membrane protein assembly factor BamB
MALASDDTLYVVHQDGRLKALSTSDGYVVRETQVPKPAWDGLAIAENRLFLTTQSGELVCLGE